MAKSKADKKAGKAKKRPGQALAVRNAQIANAQYGEVGASSFDIRELVAQVAEAQSSKDRPTKKKLLKAEADLGAALAKKDQAQFDLVTAETEDAESEERELVTQRRALDRVKKTPRPVKRAPKRDYEDDFDSSDDDDNDDVEDAQIATPKRKALKALRAFESQLKEATEAFEDADDNLIASSLAELEALSVKASSLIRALPESIAKRVLLTRYMGLFRAYVRIRGQHTGVSRWVDKVSKLKGKIDDEGGILPALKNAAKLGAKNLGRKVVGGLNRGVNSALAHLPAPVAAFMVKATNAIGSGLKFVGKAIKVTGIDTMKWVGRKLADLTSRVMGLFRSARNFLSGGDAADLFSMGAIALGILPSLVEGLVGELKKRFGDDFVMGFIKEKWEDAKKYVSEFLTKFVDDAVKAIKNLPETLKTLGEKASSAASGAGHLIKEAISSSKSESIGSDDYNAAKESGKVPITRQLSNLLDTYDAANTPAEKERIAARLVQMVNSSSILKTSPQVIASLQRRGININAKVNNATNTSTTTANSTAAPINDRSAVGSPSIVSPSSTSNTNVSVTPPPSNPASVITEKPQVSAESNSGAMDDAGTATPVSRGLNNASVPNNAADETLTFMNLSSMGA